MHEVGLTAARELDPPGQSVTVRKDGKGGRPDLLQPEPPSGQRDNRRIAACRKLGGNCMDVEAAVRREVAVTHEEDVAKRA